MLERHDRLQQDSALYAECRLSLSEAKMVVGNAHSRWNL